ncbi:hypothetical protein CDAR_411332 [Caerostris darwini]|uniref:Uncharacterized protein n=1 Tax=Caerostris darwini TaxID=1538125 RepID=A0AAV4SD08_9ARAC|nr:hypothetical protein CDAR_411332 [Caerostris darwini]
MGVCQRRCYLADDYTFRSLNKGTPHSLLRSFSPATRKLVPARSQESRTDKPPMLLSCSPAIAHASTLESPQPPVLLKKIIMCIWRFCELDIPRRRVGGRDAMSSNPSHHISKSPQPVRKMGNFRKWVKVFMLCIQVASFVDLLRGSNKVFASLRLNWKFSGAARAIVAFAKPVIGALQTGRVRSAVNRDLIRDGACREVTAMYFPALVFLSLLVVVSMATHRNFERYNSLQRSRRLGEGCAWSSDCSVQYSHCDAQTRECTCLPYHFQANSSVCLPASLLGMGCEADQQCQLKVADSWCPPSKKVCGCQENFLRLRMDRCLPPASVGDYCVSDAHCGLSDPNSRCRFIVPGVYGKCECYSPLPPDSTGKCAPDLGGSCEEDADCERATPYSTCNEGTCRCLLERKGQGCTSPAQSEVSLRPVSLGLPCVAHNQCQARDPHSQCQGGRCECARLAPTCSSANTRCLNDTFQCTNGQCISWYFLCDGEKNCKDGSDEDNCTPFACPPQSFQCNDGTCLSRSSVCNGRWECPDGSDEARCYTGIPCDGHSFRCASGQCVPAYAFCNAVVDCLDGSDEDFAVCERGEGCPAGSFQCGNGRCRSSAILCSGLDGCGDNTDEDRCTVCRCEAPE